MFKKLKKTLSLVRQETGKPLHAGEVYHLWETLTSSYNLISLVEIYMMNTEDKELHILLQGISKGTVLTRINRLEKILKEEGFTVPPRPSSKTLQGKPGAGQEVKLDDDEVIRNLAAWGHVLLMHDGRAIGAATRESVRKVFTDIVFDDMKAYSMVVNLGKKRHVFNPPPPATARSNSLNMSEVATIWDELGARHLSIMNLETYLANTNDPELIRVLKIGLKDVVLPQLERLENILKDEGFTVPARPVRRMGQGPPGKVSKIILSDAEVVQILLAAMQVYINLHITSFSVAYREDIRNMFKSFLSTEIEYLQKMMALASQRNAFNNPPVVSSKRG
jgi:hypothetical protein